MTTTTSAALSTTVDTVMETLLIANETLLTTTDDVVQQGMTYSIKLALKAKQHKIMLLGCQSSIGVVSIAVIAVLLVVGTLLNIVICVAHVVTVHVARKKSGTGWGEAYVYCCQQC